MSINNPIEGDHQSRSHFVRQIVQQTDGASMEHSISNRGIPKKIVQFWMI